MKNRLEYALMRLDEAMERIDKMEGRVKALNTVVADLIARTTQKTKEATNA